MQHEREFGHFIAHHITSRSLFASLPAIPPLWQNSQLIIDGPCLRPPIQMLFTWDTKNLCIVFPQWHVRGTASLIFSLLAIVAICAGYEALREAARRYEAWTDKQEETTGPSECPFPRSPVPIPDLVPPPPLLRRPPVNHARPSLVITSRCMSHVTHPS